MHSVISCAAGRREPDIGVARRRIADMFAPSFSGKPTAFDLVWVAFTSLTGEISRSRVARRCCGDRIFCCQDGSCRHSFHLPSTRAGRHPFGRWDYPKRQHTAHPPISPCPWATICGVSFSLRGYWCNSLSHRYEQIRACTWERRSPCAKHSNPALVRGVTSNLLIILI